MDSGKDAARPPAKTNESDVSSILLSLQNSQSVRNNPTPGPSTSRRQMTLCDLLNPTDVEPQQEKNERLSPGMAVQQSQPVPSVNQNPIINNSRQLPTTLVPSQPNNKPCKVNVLHQFYTQNFVPFIPQIPLASSLLFNTTPTSPRTPEAINKRFRTESPAQQLGIPHRPLKIYAKSTTEITMPCPNSQTHLQASQAPNTHPAKTPCARPSRKYPKFNQSDLQIPVRNVLQPIQPRPDLLNSTNGPTCQPIPRAGGKKPVQTFSEMLAKPLDNRRSNSPRATHNAEVPALPVLSITQHPKTPVRNLDQNGYYSSPQSQAPVASAHNAVHPGETEQSSLARTSGEDNTPTPPSDDSDTCPKDDDSPNPKVYDLAKIGQLRFTVIGGRTYNPQNHPICAASRMDGEGKPCRRNVSGSNSCRWHGPVEVLTSLNTVNGKLDEFGNYPPIGVKSIAEHSMFPAPAQVTPPSQAVVRPRVVHRTLRWNNEEHFWFLLGIQVYSHRWSKIAKVVGTRDTLQVQSHAQKYLERLKKVNKKKRTIHDLRIDGPEMSQIRARFTEEEIRARINLGLGDERTDDIVKMEMGGPSGAGPSGH